MGVELPWVILRHRPDPKFIRSPDGGYLGAVVSKTAVTMLVRFLDKEAQASLGGCWRCGCPHQWTGLDRSQWASGLPPPGMSLTFTILRVRVSLWL